MKKNQMLHIQLMQKKSSKGGTAEQNRQETY